MTQPPKRCLSQWLAHANHTLAQTHHNQSPQLDAQLLAQHVLQRGRASLYAHPDANISESQWQALNALLQRRASGEPMAYILGKREFWSTELKVAPSVLIPRPETELLVETALSKRATLPRGCILDLGTGSGAIAIAIANELPDFTVLAIERDAQAIEMAAINIRTLAGDNVQLVQGHWLDCVDTRCASVILANPPYLASSDSHLDSLSYEPESALVSGPNGLEDLTSIIEQARRVALPGALVVLEHGYTQACDIHRIFNNNGYNTIHTLKDLAGLDRVTYAYMPDSIPESCS